MLIKGGKSNEKSSKEYEKNQKTVSYAIVLFTVKRDCHASFSQCGKAEQKEYFP